MKTLGIMIIAAALLVSSRAAATTRYVNNAGRTIHTAHAFYSVSGFGCGFNDGCGGTHSGDFAAGWKIRGWWSVGAGGNVIVSGESSTNMFQQSFAFDDFGSQWTGTGQRFCVNNNVMNHCGNICSTNSTSPRWFSFDNTACCGAICGENNNRTLNFLP
jgi:hypothetical protein